MLESLLRNRSVLLCRRGVKQNIWSGLHVLGPDTAPLGTLSHEIAAEPGRNHRPGYLVSQTEALETTFFAETEGVYSVEIYTDLAPRETASEDRRRSISFNVREGLPE